MASETLTQSINHAIMLGGAWRQVRVHAVSQGRQVQWELRLAEYLLIHCTSKYSASFSICKLRIIYAFQPLFMEHVNICIRHYFTIADWHRRIYSDLCSYIFHGIFRHVVVCVCTAVHIWCSKCTVPAECDWHRYWPSRGQVKRFMRCCRRLHTCRTSRRW